MSRKLFIAVFEYCSETGRFPVVHSKHERAVFGYDGCERFDCEGIHAGFGLGENAMEGGKVAGDGSIAIGYANQGDNVRGFLIVWLGLRGNK